MACSSAEHEQVVQNQRSGRVPELNMDIMLKDPFRALNQQKSERAVSGLGIHKSNCRVAWVKQSAEKAREGVADEESKILTIIERNQQVSVLASKQNHQMAIWSHRHADNKENILVGHVPAQSVSDATRLEGGEASRDRVPISETSRSLPGKDHQEPNQVSRAPGADEPAAFAGDLVNSSKPIRHILSRKDNQVRSRTPESPKTPQIERQSEAESSAEKMEGDSKQRPLNPETEIEENSPASNKNQGRSLTKDRLLISGGPSTHKPSPYNLRSLSASPFKYDLNGQKSVKKISRFDHQEAAGGSNDIRSSSETLSKNNKQTNQGSNQGNSNIQKLIDEVTKNEEKWTKEQDNELVRLVSLYKVEQIAKVHKELNHYIEKQKQTTPQDQQSHYCQTKTEVECMDRWLMLRNNTEDGTVKQIKGNWTPEEDMILRKKVAEYGLKKWKEIATFLPGRIGKQCRERWYNNVDPNLNKEKWTIAEDLQLMELHKQYGNKWVQIQKMMPGRIDNDIKNRFNASLRKYKTFEQYLEANDRKREKSKKKHYWRQHYELRNVNNSKRLPLNEQDKMFKDMAQQKIQLEVGSNLPPLKNDIILEKKKELEEYREFRKLKAKVREEKRMMKLRDKHSRKRNSQNQSAHKAGGPYHHSSVMGSQVEGMSPGVDLGPNQESALSQKNNNCSQPVVYVSSFEMNMHGANTKLGGATTTTHTFEASQSASKINGSKENIHGFYLQKHNASLNNNQSVNIQQIQTIKKQLGIDSISATHYQILMIQCKQQDPKNATYLIKKELQHMLLKPQVGLRHIRADANYKEQFRCFKVPRDSSDNHNQSVVNPFEPFDNKNFRELFMPIRNESTDGLNISGYTPHMPEPGHGHSDATKFHSTWSKYQHEQGLSIPPSSSLAAQNNNARDDHATQRPQSSLGMQEIQQEKVEGIQSQSNLDQEQHPDMKVMMQRKLLQEKIQSQLQKIKLLSQNQLKKKSDGGSIGSILPIKRQADPCDEQKEPLSTKQSPKKITDNQILALQNQRNQKDCHDLKRQRREEVSPHRGSLQAEGASEGQPPPEFKKKAFHPKVPLRTPLAPDSNPSNSQNKFKMLSKLLLASHEPRAPKQSSLSSVQRRIEIEKAPSQLACNSASQQKKQFTKGFQYLNSSLQKQLMSQQSQSTKNDRQSHQISTKNFSGQKLSIVDKLRLIQTQISRMKKVENQ